MYRRLPYNPEKDLAPVTMLSTIPLVLVANKSVPGNLVEQLSGQLSSQHTRAQPGEKCPRLAENVQAGRVIGVGGCQLGDWVMEWLGGWHWCGQGAIAGSPNPCAACEIGRL